MKQFGSDVLIEANKTINLIRLYIKQLKKTYEIH